MSGPGQVTMALPRPGPALKVVLVLIAAVGLFEAIVVNHVGGGRAFMTWLLCSTEGVRHYQLWRLVTSGLLTSPDSFNHLLFTLLGLYFLSSELERRWGSVRFIRFLLTSIIVGNLFSLAVATLFPNSPNAFFGADAAIAAIGVAWGREFPDLEIRLFFFLPVKGRILIWIAVGFALLGFVYPSSVPAGPAAPFGGIVVGLFLAGTPSMVRTMYLKLRLKSLARRAAGGSQAEPDLRPGAPPRRGRANAPPLRVAYGGLEEELKKRKPPKDKRYLN